MSLFDGVTDDLPQKKPASAGKRATEVSEEALISRYGAGTRSYARSTAAEDMRRARREATEKYLRGEMTFDPLEPLCYCGGLFSTSYQWITEPGIGHPIHIDEMEQFRKEYHGRLRKKSRRV